MSDPPSGVTRRELLAGIATGGVGSLAGCTCPGRNLNFVLQVDVSTIAESGDVFVGEIEVGVQKLPEDFQDEENPASASYHDVTVLGYDHTGTEVLRLDLGDFDPGTVTRRQFQTTGFPLIVTATAADVTTHAQRCVFPDTGAQIKGYFGYAEPSTNSTDRGGHVWKRLDDRRIDEQLPPPTSVFERLKCEHRAAVQPHPKRPLVNTSDDSSALNLSLVPGSDSWTQHPIPSPTVRERFLFTAGRPANERDLRRYEKWNVTVPLSRCPSRVQDAIRNDRPVGWINESEFFEGVSRLEGRQVASPEALPACSNENVFCDDTRGVNCGRRRNAESRGQFTGAYSKYVWYFTEFEDDVYPIVADYRKKWLPPDAPAELPPCTDEREEDFRIDLSRHLRIKDEIEAVSVPDWLPRYIDDSSSESGPYPVFPSASKWKRTVATLHGLEDPQLPACRWSNVDCWIDPRTHCGEGSREAVYWATIDGDRWSIRLTYEWRALPKETTTSGG